MKNLTLLLAAGFLIWAPGSARESGSKTGAGPKAQSFSQQRERYQEEIQADLRRLRKEISSLEAKAPKKGDELRKDFDRQMAVLKRKCDLAEQKFAKLESSSRTAWQDMKPGVDAAVRDLEQAYRRAAQEFK